MDRRPTISLCIPTFNRAACLATLLESAAIQDPPFDQVVVSDDASGDDTQAVLDRFEDRFPRLTRHLCPTNIGLDANFRTMIGLATSDYVWMMGDDDRFRPGAVAAAHAALAQHPEVIGVTVGVVDYDNELLRPTGLRRRPPTQVQVGAAEVFARSADLLGLMSTMIVRRDAWNAVPLAEIGAHDNLYSQLHRVGRMLGRSGAWLILDELLVDYRSDNDQFKARLGGELPRLKRDVDAYVDIFADLFADDRLAMWAANDRILATHVLSRVRNGRMNDPQFPILGAFALLRAHYGSHPAFWRSVVPILFAPHWLVALARRAYRQLAPSSGAARARRLAASDA